MMSKLEANRFLFHVKHISVLFLEYLVLFLCFFCQFRKYSTQVSFAKLGKLVGFFDLLCDSSSWSEMKGKGKN